METLRLALSVEGDIRRTPPDAKALDKAKAYLMGQFPLRLEAPMRSRRASPSWSSTGSRRTS